jgi:glycosyltransferase involved in cell wall biosynthesis
MAKHHDITVVTRANNQAVIEAALKHVSTPHPRFLYYDPPPWIVALKKRGLPIAIFYGVWQAGVRAHVSSRLSGFDLIHHITFNSFRQPGFWWGTGRPVVLGPLGGGQICPWPFLSTFGRERLPEAFRSLTVIGSAVMPHLYFCFRAASVILSANRETTERIPQRFRHKVQSMLETAVSTMDVQQPPGPRDSAATRFIWISRFEKIKACSLVLNAFALALRTEPGMRLGIVGYGPDEAELKRLADRLGILEDVTWHGRVPKKEIPSLLRQHDVFIFSSVRDTSGNVLLEAMAAGLPAITLKHHGAREIASDHTAIRIVPTSVERTTQNMSKAMLRLAGNPDLCATLARGAHQRIVALFTWERKGAQMDRIYRQAMAGGIKQEAW